MCHRITAVAPSGAPRPHPTHPATYSRLEALERQNAELSAGLEVSRLEGSAAAAARDELREQLDQERDETLDALRKAQHAQREAQEAAEAARREAARLRATLG